MQVSQDSNSSSLNESSNPLDFAKARHNMVQKQIREQFMLDENVLNAISETPRDEFVPEAMRQFAYADTKIPLAYGTCMMTPNEEARMLGALELKPTDKVLEIGTGSGYVTTILAKLAHTVFSLDIEADFIEQAKAKISELELNNVRFIQADGIYGYSEEQPFDVICFTGGQYFLSNKIFDQVRAQGRVFAFLGERPNLKATLFKKDSQGQWSQEQLFETDLNYFKNVPTPPKFEF